MKNYNKIKQFNKDNVTENTEDVTEIVENEKNQEYGIVSKETPEMFGTVISPVGLNMREKPSTDSTVHRVLFDGANVTINQDFDDDNWYLVIAKNGDSGYVMKEFIEVK